MDYNNIEDAVFKPDSCSLAWEVRSTKYKIMKRNI